MKLRHAAALALLVALGCLGCTRHPPWHIMEAPRRPCSGPGDPALRYDCHSPDTCFDLAASLNKWSRVTSPDAGALGVSMGHWPLQRGDFASEDQCLDAIFPFRRTELLLPRCPQLTCVRADDPRLAK